MTFDYKKYSLEQLDNWMHDAISGDATPDEIYDCIINVVRESYYHHKEQTSRAYELLSKLNGNDGWTVEDVMKEKEYYEPSMPPWGHSDIEALQYTEEELNAMCDKAASDDEKEKCREYNMREAEYYDKRAQLDAQLEQIRQEGGYEWTPPMENTKSKYYYDYNRNDLNRENPFLKYDEAVAAGWTMTDDGFWIPPQNKKTWVLPIEQTFDDYFVSFPDDLLKAANLKENDQVEWIDNGDNTYTLRKVTKLSRGESYDDFENPCDMVES